MKTLGDRIRELRNKKDLSLRELARKLEISAAFLSDIELARRYPAPDGLRTMARELGTTVEDLKSYDNRPPVQELRKMASTDPAVGIALRKMVDRQVSPEEIIKLANQNQRKRSRGKPQ